MPALRHRIEHLFSLLHLYASRKRLADMAIIYRDRHASIRICCCAC